MKNRTAPLLSILLLVVFASCDMTVQKKESSDGNVDAFSGVFTPLHRGDFETDLWASHFVDEDYGWVAGSAGYILHTDDGGATWNRQETGTELDFRDLFFLDRDNGWAVANFGTDQGFGNGMWSKGTLFHTTDGGETWALVREFGDKLDWVRFNDSDTGWIQGGPDGAYETTDGGESWNPIDRLPEPGYELSFEHEIGTHPHNVAAVSFVDEETGWLCGTRNDPETSGGFYGMILHTTDNGDTWQIQYEEYGMYPRAIDFYDADFGVVAGYYGAKYVTRDGGSTWTKHARPGRNTWLESVEVLNEQEAIAFGWAGTAERTTDGGQTWQSAAECRADDLYAVHMVDADNGWAVGQWGLIYRLSDHGAVHQIQESGVTEHLADVTFVDAQTGWAVGWYGTIVHTSDGGNTWTDRSISTDANFTSVHFVDANEGWVAGEFCDIYHTDDGGVTWTLQKEGSGAWSSGGWQIDSLFFLDAERGWAVGDECHFTVDGGETWRVMTDGSYPLSEVRHVHLWDGGSGIAQRGRFSMDGHGAVIWEESDSEGWPSPIGDYDHYTGELLFVNETTGYVLGGYDDDIRGVGKMKSFFCHTDNRGESWNRVDLEMENTLFDISFYDGGSRAVLVGDWGLIMTLEL